MSTILYDKHSKHSLLGGAISIIIVSIIIGCTSQDYEYYEDKPEVVPEKWDFLDSIGLPLVIIETVNGEIPTCDVPEKPQGVFGSSITNATKVPGKLYIHNQGIESYNSGDYIQDVSGITIKIRGNTSAHGLKKPYKIKLQKKADLLGLGGREDKNWLLLAGDFLNNNIGFKLNELMGMQWTPAYTYVNVLLNGDYIGLYMLCESVSRNVNCRLNVAKTGFIFEYDPYWWNEDLYVKSPTLPHPMNYTFKYPDVDDLTDEQLSYFTQMITEMELSVANGTYNEHIDLNSFVSWMLAHEILGNWDGAGSNYYITKYDNTTSTKIMMANLWDFSTIFWNEGKWDGAHDMFLFDLLFKDAEFIKAFKEKWYEVEPTIFDELISYMEWFVETDEACALNKSLKLENERWNNSLPTIPEYVETAREWFLNRREWLNDAIEKM